MVAHLHLEEQVTEEGAEQGHPQVERLRLKDQAFVHLVVQVVEEEEILLPSADGLVDLRFGPSLEPSPRRLSVGLGHAKEGVGLVGLGVEVLAVADVGVVAVGFPHPADDELLGGEVVFQVIEAFGQGHGSSSLGSASSSRSRSRSKSEGGEGVPAPKGRFQHLQPLLQLSLLQALEGGLA